METLIIQAMAITTVAKVLVDMTRLGYPKAPRWIWPVAALVYSVVVSLLILAATGDAVTAQSVAQSILSAILAAGAAVGVTELQKRV